MRYPELIPASDAMLSSTTFREEFDSGLTRTGSKRHIFEQEFLLTEFDFSLKCGCTEDVDDWDLSMYSQPICHLLLF